MSLLELSSNVGLVAVWLLTLNLALGLLLGVRYNPWKHWPHRRFNYFKVHNWTGYVALALCVLHVLLLRASPEAKFSWANVLYPPGAPKQPTINTLGAVALYVLVLVLVTSYYRVEIGRRRWKWLHYGAYVTAGFMYVHGIWSDQTLKDHPIDYLDAEKVSIEACLVIIAVATVLRIRWALQARHAHRLHAGAHAIGRNAA